MFKYCLYKIGQFFVNRLPLSFSYKVIETLCDIQYAISKKDRMAVRTNLQYILQNDHNIDHLTRDVFRNFGRYLIEFFRMERYLNKEFVASNVELVNTDAVNEVLKEGKGAIILTAHIGNWEMGGAILSLFGAPITAVALPHKESPVNKLFNRQREMQGIKVVPTSIAIRRCLEALKNNECVALLGDRDFNTNSGGFVLDFLNKRSIIPKGAAIFSIKTGAPIVPAFLIRRSRGKFIVKCYEPIRPSGDTKDISDESVKDLMMKYVKVIEKEIFQNPSQWIMFREFAV